MISAVVFALFQQKNEINPQCTIEKINRYEHKDASYTFNELDGMTEKYEIQVNYLLSVYLDGEHLESREEQHFLTSDDEFYNDVKRNPEQYGLYEVTVKIDNKSNEKIFDIDWDSDIGKHTVIAADFAVEGKSVDAKKEEKFCFVEQANELLTFDKLKMIYKTESNLNNYQEVYMSAS